MGDTPEDGPRFRLPEHMRVRPDRGFWQGTLGVAREEELTALASDPERAWKEACTLFDTPVSRDAFRLVTGFPAGQPDLRDEALARDGVPEAGSAWPAIHILLTAAFITQKDLGAFDHALAWWLPAQHARCQRDGAVERRAAALLLYAHQPELLARVFILSNLYRPGPSRYRQAKTSFEDAAWLGDLLDEDRVRDWIAGWTAESKRRSRYVIDGCFALPDQRTVVLGLRRSRSPLAVETAEEVRAGAPQIRSSLAFGAQGQVRLTTDTHATMTSLAEWLIQRARGERVTLVADEDAVTPERIADMVKALVEGDIQDGDRALRVNAVRFEARHMGLEPHAMTVQRSPSGPMLLTLQAIRQEGIIEHHHLVQAIFAEFGDRPVDLLLPNHALGGLVRFSGSRLTDDYREALISLAQARWGVKLAYAKSGRRNENLLPDSVEADDIRRYLADGAVIRRPTETQSRLARGWPIRKQPLASTRSFNCFRCGSTSFSSGDEGPVCNEWVEMKQSAMWKEEHADRERDPESFQQCPAGHRVAWSALRFHEHERRIRVFLLWDNVLKFVEGSLTEVAGAAPILRDEGEWDLPGQQRARVVCARERTPALERALEVVDREPLAVVWCRGPESAADLRRQLHGHLILLGDLEVEGAAALRRALHANKVEAQPDKVFESVASDAWATSPAASLAKLCLEVNHGLVKVDGALLTPRAVPSMTHRVVEVLINALSDANGGVPKALSVAEISNAIPESTKTDVTTALGRANRTLGSLIAQKRGQRIPGTVIVKSIHGHHLDPDLCVVG